MIIKQFSLKLILAKYNNNNLFNKIMRGLPIIKKKFKIDKALLLHKI